MSNAERDRLRSTTDKWKSWGPYLAERAWATVREDYSDDGDVWGSFPHDQARSRAYRWSEDGLGAICDEHQRLCFGFAFWNGNDPILKERLFGLTGPQGNHGEDVKECWHYLDSTPTHSWMQWRYLYPQAEFPYERLITENAGRGRAAPEFELPDTGIFDEGRYFEITADYAKNDVDDWCIEVRIRNAGPARATLHVLPTVWFRNTWSWGNDEHRPTIRAQSGRLVAQRRTTGTMVLSTDRTPTELLLCENDSNRQRLWNQPNGDRAPKDGINDRVVDGSDSVNHDGLGTKASIWLNIEVAAGATEVARLRFGPTTDGVDARWHETMAARRREADEFYAALTTDATAAEDAMIMRQAFAGMLWSKQWYHFDVARWLDGDPIEPPPPDERAPVAATAGGVT